MQEEKRFVDPGDTIYQLMSALVLVECPRCGQCASHQPIHASKEVFDMFLPRRLTCGHCGLVRDWQNTTIQRMGNSIPARDDYFHEILWVRGMCHSKEIWAYNWRHLDLIEKYVSATHRVQLQDQDRGWANRTFLNRLPKWIASAKNRDEVLRTIERIRRDRKSDSKNF